MGYIGDLKSNKLSVRVTDETLEFINSFPGDRLSEKFEAIIRTVKDNQIDQISGSEDKLQGGTDKLGNNVGYAHAPGEQFENEQFLIKKMLQQNGFIANRDLIARMQLLNSITERVNTLQDIKKAYQNHEYPYGYSTETDQLIERIAKSLAYQERCQVREKE